MSDETPEACLERLSSLRKPTEAWEAKATSVTIDRIGRFDCAIHPKGKLGHIALTIDCNADIIAAVPDMMRLIRHQQAVIQKIKEIGEFNTGIFLSNIKDKWLA